MTCFEPGVVVGSISTVVQTGACTVGKTSNTTVATLAQRDNRFAIICWCSHSHVASCHPLRFKQSTSQHTDNRHASQPFTMSSSGAADVLTHARY